MDKNQRERGVLVALGVWSVLVALGVAAVVVAVVLNVRDADLPLWPGGNGAAPVTSVTAPR